MNTKIIKREERESIIEDGKKRISVRATVGGWVEIKFMRDIRDIRLGSLFSRDFTLYGGIEELREFVDMLNKAADALENSHARPD